MNWRGPALKYFISNKWQSSINGFANIGIIKFMIEGLHEKFYSFIQSWLLLYQCLLDHTYYEEENCETLGYYPLSIQKSKNSREERTENTFPSPRHLPW